MIDFIFYKKRSIKDLKALMIVFIFYKKGQIESILKY